MPRSSFPRLALRSLAVPVPEVSGASLGNLVRSFQTSPPPSALALTSLRPCRPQMITILDDRARALCKMQITAHTRNGPPGPNDEAFVGDCVPYPHA